MFGVVHVCARDRFSGKIVGHATVTRMSNFLIYEEIYSLMITFSIYKNDAFRIKVSYSLSRSSLMCNTEITQLVFYNVTSFYGKLFPKRLSIDFVLIVMFYITKFQGFT